MATIYRPTITRRHKKTGQKIRTKARHWYLRYKDSGGILRQVKGYTDKAATKALANELERRAARQEVGMVDPYEQHRRRPVDEHLSDFERHLAHKDDTAKHIELTVNRVGAVLEGIGAQTPGDIDAGRVAEYLAERRGNGLSIESSNHYFRALRSFCRWLVKDRRLAENPVKHLSTLKADKDRRRRRRGLTEDEFAKVIGATLSARPRNKMSGEDRVMLYMTAAYTGFRAQELASLAPPMFNFESDPASITISAAASKHGEEDMLPLRADLAALHKSWMDDKPIDAPLWPGRWWARAAEMLRADMELAGVPYVDASGRVADFHGLRHTFVSNLAKGGVHPKVAQTLARHKTLSMTMNVYTHTFTGDLVTALEALPALPPTGCDCTPESVSATGTDEAAPEQSVAPQLAHDPVSSCHSLTSDGTNGLAGAPQADVHKSQELSTIDGDWHDMSSPGPRGGTGRRSGLKIRFPATGVRVRIPPGPVMHGVVGCRT